MPIKEILEPCNLNNLTKINDDGLTATFAPRVIGYTFICNRTGCGQEVNVLDPDIGRAINIVEIDKEWSFLGDDGKRPLCPFHTLMVRIERIEDRLDHHHL